MVHLTRPEGGDLGALHTCFNLKDTLKTTFFVGSSDGELVYADWIKPEVITICCHSVLVFQRGISAARWTVWIVSVCI